MKRLLIPMLLCAFSAAAQNQAWTLERCIEHAFANNIQILQGELGVDMGEINREQRIAGTLPNLNAGATHGYNFGRTIDPFTNTFANQRIRSNSLFVGTNVTLFNGFQNLNSIRQSNIDLEAAKADLEQLRNDVALNVANAFLNVLFTDELIRIAKSNLQVTDAQVNRMGKMVDSGAMPRGFLLDLQAQQAQDEATLVQAENNRQIAVLILTQLLQLEPSEARNFEIVTPDLSNVNTIKMLPTADAAVSNALNSFPEIRASQARLLSAEKGLVVARGMRSPSLDLRYSFGTGYSGANLQPVGDPINLGNVPIGTVVGSNDLVMSIQEVETFSDFAVKPFRDQIPDNLNQSLFFTLSIPVFNGRMAHSAVQRAKINLMSSELTLENTRNVLRQNVERAYADALAAKKSFEANAKALEASEEAMNYAESRYESGASNFVDYQASRTRLDAARANFLNAKFDFIFKSKIVDFYMGQPISLKP
jgi:outer membrane protein